MLIALMTVYLLGGGSLEPLFDKQTRAAVKQSVKDEARQREVLATIKSIEGSRKGATKAAKGPRKDLADLEANRSASVDDIEAELKEIVSLRNDLQDALIAGIFDMRENMTAEEWHAVFGNDHRKPGVEVSVFKASPVSEPRLARVCHVPACA